MTTVFAQNLKRLREAAKMTQEQLEEAASVSGGQVAKWEAGRRPKPPTIVKIARALKIDAAELDAVVPLSTVATQEIDEFTYRPAAMKLLEQLPQYASVLESVRVYRTKDKLDPTVREWVAIAKELLTDLAAAEGEGIGDTAPDHGSERLAQIARKGRKR